MRVATESLLDSCELVPVSVSLLRAAARVASRAIRTLDAIHLASAQQIAADGMLVYDRKLAEAAEAAGLVVSAPGRGSS